MLLHNERRELFVGGVEDNDDDNDVDDDDGDVMVMTRSMIAQ